MARLTAPNGSTVNVSDERAKVLLSQGYTEAGKSSTKSTSSSKTGSSSAKSEK